MADEMEQPTEKKIIIDENWKDRAQAEKDQAAVGERAPKKTKPQPLPPASISFLFSTLATQAFITLGFVPNPLTQKTETDLDQAKHFIDMLGVLEEKTQGNLTPEERKQLDMLLFDLRMQYVEASSKAPS